MNPRDQVLVYLSHHLKGKKLVYIFIKSRFTGVKEVSKGHALFPTFSLINHSCSSNCRYLPYWTEEGKIEMEVRVCSPVAKGEELTIQYTRSVHPFLFVNWNRVRLLVRGLVKFQCAVA